MDKSAQTSDDNFDEVQYWSKKANKLLGEKNELTIERGIIIGSFRRCITALNDLIADSEGVYGLHQNGDPSPWPEIEEGGHYEEWLLPFAEATRLLSKLEKDI